MLKDVYCVADGLKLYLEQSRSYIVQNMFYNRWTHDHVRLRGWFARVVWRVGRRVNTILFEGGGLGVARWCAKVVGRGAGESRVLGGVAGWGWSCARLMELVWRGCAAGWRARVVWRGGE